MGNQTQCLVPWLRKKSIPDLCASSVGIRIAEQLEIEEEEVPSAAVAKVIIFSIAARYVNAKRSCTHLQGLVVLSLQLL